MQRKKEKKRRGNKGGLKKTNIKEKGDGAHAKKGR